MIAKFVTPGDNEPSGFILTTILEIVGAFLATYLGQAIGWYRADEGAGLIGAVIGAIIILVIWGFIAHRRRSSPQARCYGQLRIICRGFRFWRWLPLLPAQTPIPAQMPSRSLPLAVHSGRLPLQGAPLAGASWPRPGASGLARRLPDSSLQVAVPIRQLRTCLEMGATLSPLFHDVPGQCPVLGRNNQAEPTNHDRPSARLSLTEHRLRRRSCVGVSRSTSPVSFACGVPTRTSHSIR